MRAITILCGCLLAVAIGAALVQKRTISSLRNENQALQQQQEEAAQLTGEKERISALRIENQQVQSLIQANRDLPKLRNEVRQLRELQGEIARLRQENQRLAATAQPGDSRPNALANTEGYVPNEQWTYAGFATPEATIQSWFLAMREGNWQQFTASLSSNMQKIFERQFRNKSEEQRALELKEGIGSIARIGGYQIAHKEEAGHDAMVVGIRAAAGGEVMKIQLSRYGNEWRIDGHPQ